MFKKGIRLLFNSIGLELRRKQLKMKPQVSVADVDGRAMKDALSRLGSLRLPVSAVIDVGAAEGRWTLSAKSFWPQAKFVMFEPLAERQPLLQRMTEADQKIFYSPFAAGRETGEIAFEVTADLDGSGVSSGTGSSNVRKVEVRSISAEMQRLNIAGPFIIKLDTHGYEIPIIEGCQDISKDIVAFIIECYGFQIASDSLLFWELCAYMDRLGFRVFDIVDVMNRPLDHAFWQCDIIFIRKNHTVFSLNNYASL